MCAQHTLYSRSVGAQRLRLRHGDALTRHLPVRGHSRGGVRSAGPLRVSGVLASEGCQARPEVAPGSVVAIGSPCGEFRSWWRRCAGSPVSPCATGCCCVRLAGGGEFDAPRLLCRARVARCFIRRARLNTAAVDDSPASVSPSLLSALLSSTQSARAPSSPS